MHIKSVCDLEFEDFSVANGLLILKCPYPQNTKRLYALGTLDPGSMFKRWQDSTGLNNGFVIRSLSTNGQLKSQKASYKAIQKEIALYIKNANLQANITCKLIGWGPGLKDCQEI